MKPQTRAVLDLLTTNPDGITPLEALFRAGSLRLGARIWELKVDGYDIETTMVTTPTGKRIARYRLREKAA